MSADESGYYVFRVRLSDTIWEEVQDKEVSDFKIYGLADSEEEINAAFIIGLINTWEVFTLTGHKMERFGLREFLMVGFLNSGQPLTLFVAKLLLSFFTGGLAAACNAGFGVGAFALLVVMLRRRRK